MKKLKTQGYGKSDKNQCRKKTNTVSPKMRNNWTEMANTWL